MSLKRAQALKVKTFSFLRKLEGKGGLQNKKIPYFGTLSQIGMTPPPLPLIGIEEIGTNKNFQTPSPPSWKLGH